MRKSWMTLGLSVLMCTTAVSYADLSLDVARASADAKPKVDAAVARIKAAAGVDIPIDVRWETFGDHSHVNFVNDALKPVATAIETICKDSLGKQAVKAKVKKIVIQRTIAPMTNGAVFKDGVVTLNEQFDSNYIASSGIQSVIEKGL